jgi:hypothetical protein
MKMTVITIRDIVANLYAAPQFVQSKGSAIRAFSDEVNRSDPGNQIYKHPSDYELYALGQYDDETAQFELYSLPERLALAAELVIK